MGITLTHVTMARNNGRKRIPIWIKDQNILDRLKYERVLIWTRQDNVHTFGMFDRQLVILQENGEIL